MVKVICIKNNMPGRVDVPYKYLTIGKTYQGKERFDVNCYDITDDNGECCLYHISCFAPLDKWRENQIDVIMN
jgi:hypothetical protein